MLSDDFMSIEKKTSNSKFSEDVTDWMLGYKSLLRTGNLEHVLLEGKGVPGETKDVYRIKD